MKTQDLFNKITLYRKAFMIVPEVREFVLLIILLFFFGNLSTNFIEFVFIQEELRHFEHRIGKHEYLKEELQVAETVFGKETKNGEIPQKHVILKQKANDYGLKVKFLYL